MKAWKSAAVLFIFGFIQCFTYRILQANAQDRLQQFGVAAITFSPAPNDITGNASRVEKLIRAAAEHGARFIVLPEYALTGPLARIDSNSDALQQVRAALEREHREMFAPLARALRVWLAVPSVDIDIRTYASYLVTTLIDEQGKERYRHRKLYPQRLRGDSDFASGDPRLLNSLPTVHDNLGILSGDDIIDGVPRLAQLGARTILVSASWEDSEPVNWLLLAQRLSKEYRVRIVISNLFRGSTILDNGVASDETRTTDFVYTEFVSVPQPLRVKPPIGLPEVPQPTFAPLTESSAQLGRKLFFDPALSRDGTLSCAQCHQPDHSFANNVQVSEGIDNRRGKRNAPSLLNVAYRPLLLWDGRANSLETQLQHVLNSWTEMDNSRENVLRYLNNTPPYPDLFRAAGTSLPISFEAVARSLADFQRTLLSGASPFDHYFYGNLDQSISESAKRGFEVFTGIGGCSSCHAIQKEYALFTDNYVHNTGIGYHPRFEYLGYAGDGREENFATRNVFRGEYVTPSLRNVDLTSPYMHDGSMQTLAEVVEFYDKGGNANPFLDPQIKPLRLDEGQKHDLVEFLKTLTGVTAVQGELR